MERGIKLPGEQANPLAPNGKNYLLAIGIDKYQHWEELNNAVKDVKDFAKILVNQYQFEQEDIFFLLDGEATEAKIYSLFREIKRKINPQDNLIIYYSGHGHYDAEFDEGHWIPVDSQKDTEDRYLSNSNIIRRINAIGTHHTLLIVDACFSGTLVVKKRSGIVDEKFKSRRIFASGRTETVADGRPGENSPFAKGILTFLQNNSDKSINTTTLVQYVKSYVDGKARQTPVEGRMQNSDDEGGEFVFHLKMKEEELWMNVVAEDSVKAFENYLDYFPSGQFVDRAHAKILELKEDDIWSSAQKKNNELAYENYIRKYTPYGKYLEEANQRLQELKEIHQQRKKVLESLAEKEEERKKINEEFKELVESAEQMFNERQLAAARDQYRKALDYYMPGFIPNQAYIEEQINFCSNGIKFLTHYDNGIKAMDRRNYRLALQYFNEANLIDDNPKLEDLIRVCRQKLEKESSANMDPWEQEIEAPTPDPEPQPIVSSKFKIQRKTDRVVEEPQRPAPKKQKPIMAKAPSKGKSRMWGCLIGALGTVAVGIILFTFLVFQNNENTAYQDPGYAYDNESATTEVDPVGAEELLIGNWQVQRVFVNGQEIDQNMAYFGNYLSFSYNFQQNGNVFIASSFSTAGLNWRYTFDSEYITLLDGAGNSVLVYVSQLNDYELDISFQEVYAYTTYQVQFYLTRD